MTYPLNGLLLHLHASLADKGRAEGKNDPPLYEWYDLSHQGNDATLTNYDLTQSGWRGSNLPTDPYALSFNGASNYLSIPKSDEFYPTDQGFALDFWLRPSKSGYVLKFGSNEQGFSAYFDEDSKSLTVEVITSTKKTQFSLSDILLNQWKHYTFSFTGDRLWGFVDAAPQGFSLPSEGSFPPTDSDLYIGGTSTGDRFDGRLSVVRLYGRGLEFDEVSASHESGQTITSENSDFRGKGYVLYRDDLESNLNISITSRMQGRYELIKNVSDDLPSTINVNQVAELDSTVIINPNARVVARYEISKVDEDSLEGFISVTKFSDLLGNMDVNPIASIKGRYDIHKAGSDDLGGNISITHTSDLEGNVSVNPWSRVVAKYDSDYYHLDDLHSNLKVGHAPNLKGFITVDLREVNLRAKYGTLKTDYGWFEGTIQVFQPNYLPSTLDVNVNVGRFVRGKYKIEPIYVEDLISTITVNSVSQLPSNILVNTSSRMVAKYSTEGIHVYDLSSIIIINSTSNLPSTVSVTSEGKMVARYGTLGIHIDELESNIVVPNTEDLKADLFIPLLSGMTGRYDVSPIYLYDLPTTLGIREFNELYGEMFINMETRLHSVYNVTPIYFDWLPSYFTVREVADLPSLLRLTPQGYMRSKYDLVERPSFRRTLYPNKDAFVREFYPRLNYGSESSMYTGATLQPFPERFRSYVGFDITPIPTENTEVGKAVLKIYYDGRGSLPQDVEVLRPSNDWTETGLTWANQPFPTGDIEFNVTQKVDGKGKYIEFDVTPIVKGWHEGKEDNFGFLLKALDENEINLKGFSTKESIERRPELEVTFYDLKIYSYDYLNLHGTVEVRQQTHNDLYSTFKVKQYNFWEDLEGHLKVKHPNMLETYIWVTHPDIYSSLVVRHSDKSTLDGTITVRVKGEPPAELDGFIRMHKERLPSDIYVLYRDDIEGEIVARRWGDPWTDGGQLPSEIAVSESYKSSSIYVFYREDLTSSLGVRVWANEDDPQNSLLVEFEITRNFELHGSLTVLESDNLDSNLGVRVEDATDQPSEVYVKFREDLEGYGNIGNPRLKSHIEVWEKSLLSGDMTVRQNPTSDLDSTIFIPVGDISDLNADINLRMMYDKPGTITIRSGNLGSFIGVPRNAEKDVVSVLDVRVSMVSDLESLAEVNSGNLGSKIAVRLHDEQDKKSSIKVRREDDSDLPIEGQILYRYSMTSRIAVNKPRYKDIYSYGSIRVEGEHDQPSTISVRQWGDPWNEGGQLKGTIAVRVWDNHSQPSSIAARRWGDPETDGGQIEGTISVWHVSWFSGDLTVRQTDHSDLGGHIAAYEHFNLYGTVACRRWGDPETDGGQLPSSITVRQTDESELDGLIEVYEHDNLDSTLNVRRWGDPWTDGGQLECTISIRTWNDPWTDGGQLEGDISARQKDASDLHTYIFSVRRGDTSDLPVDALIKRVSNLECHIEVVTAYPYAYIM